MRTSGTGCFVRRGVGPAGDDDAAGGRHGPDSVCVCEVAGAGGAVQLAGDGDSEDVEWSSCDAIRRGGAAKQIEAAYCIFALPFSILKKIPNDLSPAVQGGGGREHAWAARTRLRGRAGDSGSRTTTSMAGCRM